MLHDFLLNLDVITFYRTQESRKKFLCGLTSRLRVAAVSSPFGVKLSVSTSDSMVSRHNLQDRSSIEILEAPVSLVQL